MQSRKKERKEEEEEGRKEEREKETPIDTQDVCKAERYRRSNANISLGEINI
jgi:hypothetical protein